MNRNKLKAYASQARRDFIQAITDRASFYGLTRAPIYWLWVNKIDSRIDHLAEDVASPH